MLVLTRKLMEKVYIGDHICVTVVRLDGGQVRLGIDAPREISVIRAELVDNPDGVRSKKSRQDQPAETPVAGPNHRHGPVRPRPSSVRGSGNPRRGPSQ